MTNSEKKYFHLSTLEKGFKILELLAENGELTVTMVAKCLGFDRTRSHRFLATLRELGYVAKNADARYKLTFKLLELGMKIANRFEIRRVARPYMEELASGCDETVNLGYWDGEVITHLDKIESREILRYDIGIGAVVGAYCCALGKSILAFLPQRELELYLDSVELKRLTPNTITTREALIEELKLTRKRGYAIDDEEGVQGIRCVAAPVYDYTGYTSYSVSVSGPAIRMTHCLIEQIQKDVRDICARLSVIMGKPTDDKRNSSDTKTERGFKNSKSKIEKQHR